MSSYQHWKSLYNTDDPRLQRSHKGFHAGDIVRIIDGSHRGRTGTICFIHHRNTTERPPKVTVVTTTGEQFICSFDKMVLTDSDEATTGNEDNAGSTSSSDDTASVDQDTSQLDDINDHVFDFRKNAVYIDGYRHDANER